MPREVLVNLLLLYFYCYIVVMLGKDHIQSVWREQIITLNNNYFKVHCENEPLIQFPIALMDDTAMEAMCIDIVAMM